jgi:hypothetical protein
MPFIYMQLEEMVTGERRTKEKLIREAIAVQTERDNWSYLERLT